MENEIKRFAGNVNNTTDVFIDTVKQRVNNPFVGSFILSFAALNWRPIVYFLFSKKSIEDKFVFITNNYYADQWHGWLSWCMYLFFPIVISLFYLAILPWVTESIDKFVQKTILNKSRRDHILNYRKRKNRADLAWADFKAEEARTGFEDRRNLTNELDKLKENLKKENEQVAALTLTNQNQQEQINTLNTNIKEKDLANESLNNDLEVTRNALNDRQNFIQELSLELSKSSKNIEELNKDLHNLQETNSNLGKENNGLLKKINEQDSERQDLDSQIIDLNRHLAHVNAQNDECSRNSTLLTQELNRLKADYTALESHSSMLDSEISHNSSKLSEYHEFENSIVAFAEDLRTIQTLVPKIQDYNFQGDFSVSEILNMTMRFVNELKNILIYDENPKAKTNLKLRFDDTITQGQIIDRIFTVANSMNARIFNLNLIDNGIEILMTFKEKGNLIDFINSGEGYWDLSNWEEFTSE